MTNKVPVKVNTHKTNLTKWVLLIVLGVFSILTSFAIYYAGGNKVSTPPAKGNTPNTSLSKVTPKVMVKLMPNDKEGYVDVFVSNNTPLLAISLVFAANSDVNIIKLDKNNLFADYIYKQNGNQVLVAGTGGANGKIVKKGQNQLFARLYFSGMSSKDDVNLLVNSSEAADTQNKPVKLELQ